MNRIAGAMADQPQITVNKPFEVFFPEKRPFFLENTAYFNTPIQLLFTRRIADPLVGGRATGRAGAYSAGGMVVDDRSPFDGGAGDAAQLSVVRVMRDVGRESYVGAFASRRTVGGRDNEENLIGALDGRWKLARNWFATGQAAISEQGTAWYGSLAGAGRRFNYQRGAERAAPHAAQPFRLRMVTGPTACATRAISAVSPMSAFPTNAAARIAMDSSRMRAGTNE